MQATTIIRKPLVTEKSTYEAEHNRYSFEVDRRATKTQIKQAIEELYDVRVLRVSTQNKHGVAKRTRFGWTTPRVVKKAVVKLYPGDSIELV
ncbi:MAG TPA: 50S ribosomal protein L23 [Phycisphaeraceae bacterium]|nr:50S ribosomal protein L23 [Phycisphaeraceae bacterium]